MRRFALACLLLTCGATPARAEVPVALASAADSRSDADKGRALYQARCAACHSVDAHRIGPMHRSVFGRRAGTALGYDYSDALKKSRVVWDADTLNRWLTEPEDFIPGQRMDMTVSSEENRRLLIAYLKTLSELKQGRAGEVRTKRNAATAWQLPH